MPLVFADKGVKRRIAVPGVLMAHLGFLLIAAGGPVRAQSLSTIHTFTVSASGETLEPFFLFRGNDGSIYGPAATAPGPGGALLKINADGSLTSTTINGCVPEVQAPDGNFYGRTTTSLCQLTPAGTGANISAFSQGMSALFISPTSVGAPIIGNDGSLYGVVGGNYTSSSPVSGSVAMIYKLTLGGVLTRVGLGGATYDAALIQGRDGNFYGTTTASFADQGSVYKLTPAGALTVLHKFSGADGVWPESLIYAADGALYGVTATGGASNAGTFFKIDPSGAFSLLYNFQVPALASVPVPGNNFTFIQDADGNFYGASFVDSAGNTPDIFQLSPTGAFKMVATLDPGTTVLSIINGPDGSIYGVSQVVHPTTTLGAIFKLSFGGSSSGSGSSAASVSTVTSASAFGGFSAVAPGTWVEIYGVNLASDTRSWTTADFNGTLAPTSLDQTSITVGGQPAYVAYISPTQVNALLSSNTPTGSQKVVVTSPTGGTAQYTVTVNATEPGLLAPSSFKIGGVQYAVALLPDGTYALPSNAISGINSRPARPGDTVTLYGVGFGPVTPSIPAGQLVQQSNSLALPFQISIGGVPAGVVYDGLAPQFTGLYQLNLTVPQIPAGDAALTFTLNGTTGAQTLYIPIAN